ncbi:UNVERIFIED_CONTAM: UDP-glucosyltransferase 29 [Sesamum angustifolium]|uniref:UDP-glucosyltransferase 29 n=1 Tax=Sesamum angustifolium TaxID=2727405 RepID=A0AAW2LY90_9LAMI
MPMKLNMFIDCRMLVEAGACVEVERDENGVYKGEEIATAIRKVVVESSGEGLRQRAQELSEKMKMEEGQELDEVAESLWQLCLKNKD